MRIESDDGAALKKASMRFLIGGWRRASSARRFAGSENTSAAMCRLSAGSGISSCAMSSASMVSIPSSLR